MVLGCLSTLALFGVAIAAGLGHFSFWWAAIPAFFAGSFMLSNGPHYGSIIEANRRGQVWYFPMMLTVTVAGYLATGHRLLDHQMVGLISN